MLITALTLLAGTDISQPVLCRPARVRRGADYPCQVTEFDPRDIPRNAEPVSFEEALEEVMRDHEGIIEALRYL